MAANYWESSQRRYWQFTREELEDLRKKLEDEDPILVQNYPLPQLRHLSIYFNQRESLVLPPVLALNRIFSRSCEAWETPRRTTASDGDRPAIYSPVLCKNRDPADKPVSGACDCSISCVQDGGVPAPYQAGCD
jgi:hypothetical protein